MVGVVERWPQRPRMEELSLQSLKSAARSSVDWTLCVGLDGLGKGGGDVGGIPGEDVGVGDYGGEECDDKDFVDGIILYPGMFSPKCSFHIHFQKHRSINSLPISPSISCLRFSIALPQYKEGRKGEAMEGAEERGYWDQGVVPP